jgi:anti-anti-sigma factor
MPQPLDTRFCGNVFIIECKGQVVIGKEVQPLEATLRMAEREFCRIVLAVGQVTRLDSIGLGMIVRSLDKLRKRGGDLRMAEPPAFLAQLLHITRLTGFLKTYPTEDEAVLSFLTQPTVEQAPEQPGHRVLVIDRSADLGAFVRAVLGHHGYQVRSASLVHDARMLLRFHAADYILFGPGMDHAAAQSGMASLKSVAPDAVGLELTPEFSAFDALRGAEVLLDMFQAGAKPA